MKPKARADALTKLLVISGLRKLEPVVQEEADEMTITVDVMENSVLRGYFLKAQEESEQRGMQKGRQEGRQEGEAALLRHLLQRRFGTLPEWAEARIAQAELATLETWTNRVLDAPSLEEVLMARG